MPAKLHLITSPNFNLTCLSFQPKKYLPDSTLKILEYVPASKNLTFPGNDPSCGRTSQVVLADLCRVALSIPTSNRSGIIFEIWLPENWNGRFLGTGNGGIDGCIKYDDMAYTTQYGFATTGSNNGHNGTGGLAFYKNPDVVTDFSWRSLHTTVVAGKKLVKGFYGESQTKSYYLGCSGGGRQGIQAAEMFPEDYDGIVAGCPGINFNYLSSWRASFYPITGPSNVTGFIEPKTWTGIIHEEILHQCDDLDGVTDGIIEDPSLCNFRPESLICPTPNSTNCLTPAQVQVVRKVYSPLYGEQGQLIYPGLQPGAETMAVQRLLAGQPFSYSEDWFRYAVFGDPSWDPLTFNIHDASLAERLNPSNVRTWPSTLESFSSRGGKLIAYHGGQDNQITGFDTERFYNRLSVGMSASSGDLDAWFRFFRIPGMFHCSGGPGAWSFGQGASAAAGIAFLPDVNVLAAMVQWVENGTAPETITGTKFINDTVSMGEAYQHRHCRYPYRSTYINGPPEGLNSWTCIQ
ncbi:tannase and feruloyl esterase [Glonium stellatum]|uniref:Carboxylic ester hydrolase n=1 Tax=Glonium stellatum TaxID=574774 RepID=A0A8E2EZU5_9PEZI|nr:tannase and feruloyl esterase [Glonium stellatum]